MENFLIKTKPKNVAIDANPTMVDYIKTKYETFLQDPFNEIDGLVLAQASYFDIKGMVGEFKEEDFKKETGSLNRMFKSWWHNISNVKTPFSALYKAEKFDDMLLHTSYEVSNREILYAACASPRFRDVLINWFSYKLDKETSEQFSAVTFTLPSGETIVAFRGTDSTVVGWKEDFNMTYLSAVPSQLSATRYLNIVGRQVKGDIYVVGHSKGGNLAVYAGASVDKEVQDRIKIIYDYDGLGFMSGIFDEEQKSAIQDRVIKIMPEGSIVGVMLESIGAIKVIKSNKVGIMQHEAASWEVEGNEFIKSDSVTNRVKYIDKTLNTFINNLSPEQRKTVIDTVFSLLDTIKAERLSDLGPLISKEKETIRNSIKGIDDETSKCIKEVFKLFLKTSLTLAFAKEEQINKDLEVFN